MTCTAAQHGTHWAYFRHHCRCPETVAGERIRSREYQRRLRAATPGKRRHNLNRSPYVDDIAVERATRGDVVRLTVLELAVAIRRLDEQSLCTREIARRLGISTRTVQRHRHGHVQNGLPMSTGIPEDRQQPRWNRAAEPSTVSKAERTAA